MAKQARTAMSTDEITAVADRGYFKGEEILACHEAGITVIVPKITTSGAKADGRFDRADFIYDAMIVQRKTQRPVQFERTDPTKRAITAWILRCAHDAPDQGNLDLSSDQEPAGCPLVAWSYQAGKHSPINGMPRLSSDIGDVDGAIEG